MFISQQPLSASSAFLANARKPSSLLEWSAPANIDSLGRNSTLSASSDSGAITSCLALYLMAKLTFRFGDQVGSLARLLFCREIKAVNIFVGRSATRFLICTNTLSLSQLLASSFTSTFIPYFIRELLLSFILSSI